jgi:hypothetical protein
MVDSLPTSPLGMSMIIKNTFIEFDCEASMGSPGMRRNSSEPAMETLGVSADVPAPKFLSEIERKKLEFCDEIDCLGSVKDLLEDNEIACFGSNREMLEPEYEPETLWHNHDVETETPWPNHNVEITQSTKDVDSYATMGGQGKLTKPGLDDIQKRRRRRRRGSLIDVAYWNQKREDTAVRFCQWCGANSSDSFNFCKFCGRAV